MQPCVVLAGGLGTRLRSAVPDLPKCLAPVGNRSFLEVQLAALAAYGVDRFVLSLGYMADVVRNAIRGFNIDASIDCVVESHPLGTGGAILLAMLEANLGEALVVNGDTFIDADLNPMLVPLRENDAACVAVVEIADRSRYGGVELRDSTVVGFTEKGRGGKGLINAGLYRVCRDAFTNFAPGSSFSMETQVMPALVTAETLRAEPLVGEFIDIGVPEDYWRFCARHGSSKGGR